MQSDSIKELATALAKAQATLTTPSEWAIVPNFSSYAVHPSGLVFSARSHRPAFLRGMASGNGYRVVQLKSDAGVLEKVYIHRLIATIFLPPDPLRRQVNHKDGNKLNNSIYNLEWCTCAENLEHARTTGLSRLDGERNPMAKYSRAQVEQIRALRAQGLPYSAISKTVGCSIMQANRIARGLLRKDG